MLQYGCWWDGSVHYTEYCARENEVWRSSRHVSNCQHSANTTAVNGTLRGTALYARFVIIVVVIVFSWFIRHWQLAHTLYCTDKCKCINKFWQIGASNTSSSRTHGDRPTYMRWRVKIAYNINLIVWVTEWPVNTYQHSSYAHHVHIRPWPSRDSILKSLPRHSSFFSLLVQAISDVTKVGVSPGALTDGVTFFLKHLMTFLVNLPCQHPSKVMTLS